jgi:hypothetical protein
MELKRIYRITALLLATLLTASCASTSDTNPATGNVAGTALGAAVGVGVSAVLGAPRSIIALSGLGGAGLGYYFSTLRFAAAGIIEYGGKVYNQGDFVVIEVPTDNLFDPNTDEFLPGTDVALDSIVNVLNRYPQNNIIISGNTSGFDSPRYEHKLSENRARQVAGYLWAHGISQEPDRFDGLYRVKSSRQLTYVGYGNFFPVANHIRLKGIRENSRIQITAYPSQMHLHWNQQCQCDSRLSVFSNVGSLNEPMPRTAACYKN